MEIILNPLIIANGIDRNTPLFVLKFLDAYHNIGLNPKYICLDSYFNEFKTKVEEIKNRKILFPLTELETKILNPFDNDNWTIEKANIGYESYFPFFQENLDFSLISQNMGCKTNTYPDHVNEIMIYRICKEINYKTTLYSQLDELAFAVSNFLCGNIPKLRFALSETAKKISDEQILSFSFQVEKSLMESGESEEHQIEQGAEKKLNNCDMISLTNLCFQDMNYLIRRIIPLNDMEAIILAMKRWNICLIESENAIMQYNAISRCGIENYIPINDIDFKVKYLSNKNWYNTEENWFVQLFPLYDHAMLMKFASFEGYQYNTKEKDKIIKTCLEDRNKVSNFFFQIVPYSKDRITYVERLDVSEVEHIICVGNISKEIFIYFSVTEFTEYLNYKRYLIDPISDDLFDTISINKLKMHCFEMMKIRKNKYIFSELLKIILEMETTVSLITIKIKEIFDFKEDMIPIFKDIQELGLIMRGRDQNEIPISSMDTIIPDEKKAIVFQKSFDYHKEIMDKINKFPENVLELFKNIKIVTFSQNGTRLEVMGEVLKAPNINYSISLYDCMKKVFYGNFENIECLRTSSNWILYTSSLYLKLLGEDLEYKMEEIEIIN